MRRLMIIFASGIVALPFAGHSAPVTYQGRLTDSGGQPVSGQRTLTFALHAAQSGPDAPVWMSDPVSVEIAGGLLSTSFDPPASVLLDNPELWLEVSVESEPVSGRVRVGDAAYAAVARNVAYDSVTSSALAFDPYSLYKVSYGLLDASLALTVTVNGSISFTQPDEGIYFADGSYMTSALAGGQGIPAGASVLGSSINPPAGYSYSGSYIGNLDADIWTARAAIPAPASSQPAAAAVGDIIYVTGGTGREYATSAYDTTTNTWSPLANMGNPRRLHGCVELNGLVYVFGGLSGAGATATGEVYDPAANTWSPTASLPSARFAMGAATAGGLIYCIGGADAGFASLSQVLAYDPGANTWTPVAPLPAARTSAGAAALNGLIYLAGGSTNTNPQSPDLLEYHPGTDTWTPRSPLPRGRSQLMVQAANDRLYVIGGRDSGANHYLDNDCYDPARDLWVSRRAQPAYRTAAASAVAGGRIYLIAGAGGQPNGGTALQSVDAYTPYTLFYVHTKD